MPKKTTHQDWSRKRILAELEAAGWKTMKQLAEKYNCSEHTLFGALYKPYPASEKRIAAALELHPKEIWPSRYADDGYSNRLPHGHGKRKASHTEKPTPAMPSV